ncbi:MAG: GAF domain-containing protein [Chloroflexi bacterium]|nr:GAF domain-containing protein [Chloroflexota bacterium]
MSASQTPFNNQKQSFAERIRRIGLGIIAPHTTIEELGLARHAQLLNAISLALMIAFGLDLMSRPRSTVIFYFLLGISAVSFLLGKSKFPRAGTLVFSIGFISATYLSLFLGVASNYLTSVLALVPFALIISSALTSRKIFVRLAIFATLLTILAPYYSKTKILPGNVPEAGGIIFFMGVILYGVTVFRSSIEQTRLEEINTINKELRENKTNLEEHVEERTRLLAEVNQQNQERAKRLLTISEISQDISANVEKQTGDLLAHIARSISEKLGFYHVGIFLLDENREYAVLRAANSQGGQHMLERHHQLKVGGTGIVGYVSQGGRPRIALDTGSDAVFFNNPDLPKTRSEIALPLKYGTKVIGVLDVQSTLSSAFKEEDVNILGTLSNQIALIISNGLTAETQRHALPSISAIKSTDRKQKQSGYYYLPDGTISTALPANSPILEKALESGETEVLAQPSRGNPPALAVPVKFRDQVIGIIHIQATEETRKWTEDEVAMVQSIADRTAFSLENARLFEETTRRAEQEETIARVTTQIGSSSDFSRILQTTIQELGQALGVSRSFIQLGTPSKNGNEDKSKN